jgi:hypothetical protein
VKTPTWDEILEFPRLDRWTQVRATGHDFFEKTLPDGEILQTHASRSGNKSMSPGRFKAILADQLRVSESEFWDVLRSGKPAPRPSLTPEPPPSSIPAWLASALEREVGLTQTEIAQLDEAAARSMLHELRSRPRT